MPQHGASSLKTATILALVTAVLSGTANFVNKIGLTVIKDPIVYTTLKNVLVAAFLAGLAILLKRNVEVRSLSRKNLVRLLLIGAVGGSLPFALFFSGLARTSAINASLIHKSLFIWVAILAVPFLKERLAPLQWAGVGALFAANLAIGGFAGFKFDAGELMILCATLLWAVENIIAKKALADVSSQTVAAARMAVGALLLLPFALWRGGAETALRLSPEQWAWALLSSALLIGYVLCWYAALERAPASYVAAMLVPATLVTNVLSAAFVTHAFPPAQAVSAVLFTIGAAAVVVFAKRPAPLATARTA